MREVRTVRDTDSEQLRPAERILETFRSFRMVTFRDKGCGMETRSVVWFRCWLSVNISAEFDSLTDAYFPVFPGELQT